jgi:hypothetical protein
MFKQLFIGICFLLILHYVYIHYFKPQKIPQTTSLCKEIGQEILEEHHQHIQEEPHFPEELKTFTKQLLLMTVGKFHLTDVAEVIPIVNQYVLSNPSSEIDDDTHLLEISRRIFYSGAGSILSRLFIGQYICLKTDSNEEIHDIYTWIYTVSLNQYIPIDIRMNASDILRTSNNNMYIKKATYAINHIREDEARRDVRRPQVNNDFQQILWNDLQAQRPKQQPRTIYMDSQNVHTKDINTYTNNTMRYINDNYYDPSREFEHKPINNKSKRSIQRIKTDSSTFDSNKTLYTTYQAILNYIDQHPNDKAELEHRLDEEIQEMSGLCATGHLSRLVSVTQGFMDQPNIKVDPTDEIYASFSNRVQKNISEPLMEEMLDKTDAYRTFLDSEASALKIDLQKEYKDVVNDSELDVMLDTAKKKFLGEK